MEDIDKVRNEALDEIVNRLRGITLLRCTVLFFAIIDSVINHGVNFTIIYFIIYMCTSYEYFYLLLNISVIFLLSLRDRK